MRVTALRELAEAVREDHRVLIETRNRYDARRPAHGPVAATFVTNVGFQVVVGYRVMRCLRALELTLAARVVARFMRHLYACDVHWDADLAPGLVVVHGFGVAISYAARTGHGCIVCQGVTLGVGSDPATGATGAPELGEDVVVGPGAALIGPIVVGTASKITSNCTVAESVPPRSVVEAPAISTRARS